MKQRLYILFFALVGLTLGVKATDYGLKVGGVAVTSDNYSNISAAGGFSAVTSGTVTYAPSTRTLTLSNAVIRISGGYSGIDFMNNSASYNLVLAEGTVNVVTIDGAPAVYTMAPLTIAGGGTLVLNSNGHCGLYADYSSTRDYTLNITNCTLFVSGRWGITGGDDGLYGTVNIENSIVSTSGTAGSMTDLKALTLNGVELYAPSGAMWKDTAHAVCDESGTTVNSKVTFGPENANSSAGNAGGSSQAGGVRGDINGDGSLTLADVTTLVDILLGRSVVAGHRYVDLGLPSGTLWATCNVGAENPEDLGDYFAWGEASGYNGGKSYFLWYTYAHIDYQTYASSQQVRLKKYNYNSSVGYNHFVDNLMELQPEDDAASVNWGGGWCTPSKEQFEELFNNSYTTTQWTQQNGANGRLITSRSNGNRIFIPVQGYQGENGLEDESIGCYWTRTLSEYNPTEAQNAYFDRFNSGQVSPDARFLGQGVRPVLNGL